MQYIFLHMKILHLRNLKQMFNAMKLVKTEIVYYVILPYVKQDWDVVWSQRSCISCNYITLHELHRLFYPETCVTLWLLLASGELNLLIHLLCLNMHKFSFCN